MSSDDAEKVTFGATVEPMAAMTTKKTPDVSEFEFPSKADQLSTIAEKDSTRTGSTSAAAAAADSPSSARSSTSDRTTVAPTSAGGYEHDPANPFSPFYEHGHARRSADLSTPTTEYHTRQLLQAPPSATTEGSLQQAPKNPIAISLAALESGTSLAPTITSKSPAVSFSKECAMWPSKDTLLARQRAEKLRQRRGRASLADCFSRLTRRQRLLLQVVVALLVVGAAVGIGVGISRAVGGGIWAPGGQTNSMPADDD